jgi:hypothetical protein
MEEVVGKRAFGNLPGGMVWQRKLTNISIDRTLSNQSKHSWNGCASLPVEWWKHAFVHRLSTQLDGSDPYRMHCEKAHLPFSSSPLPFHLVMLSGAIKTFSSTCPPDCDMIFSISHTSSHLILQILWCHYSHPHLTDEETDLMKKLSRVTFVDSKTVSPAPVFLQVQAVCTKITWNACHKFGFLGAILPPEVECLGTRAQNPHLRWSLDTLKWRNHALTLLQIPSFYFCWGPEVRLTCKLHFLKERIGMDQRMSRAW